MYAKVGIAEYWIVDITTNVVRVYRQPSGFGYASVTEERRSGRSKSQRCPASRLRWLTCSPEGKTCEKGARLPVRPFAVSKSCHRQRPGLAPAGAGLRLIDGIAVWV